MRVLKRQTAVFDGGVGELWEQYFRFIAQFYRNGRGNDHFEEPSQSKKGFLILWYRM